MGNVYTMASSASRVAVLVQLVQTGVSSNPGNLNLYAGGTADPHILIPTIISH